MPESLQITEFNLKRLHAKTKTLLYIEVFSFLSQTPLIILLSFCYIKQVEAREKIRTSHVQYRLSLFFQKSWQLFQVLT